MEIEWRSNPLTSALHAAEAISRGKPIVDARVAPVLSLPADRLAAEIRAADLPTGRFWGHLIPLSADIVARRQLIETAVIKTTGRGLRFEIIVSKLEGRLAELESAFRTALPELSDELKLRERPLREQWEARGPGMLQHIGGLTEETLIPENYNVLLVCPALGGGGEAHLSYNSVRIEAVLANPIGELPEVIRLAWLIAQLQLDLPVYSEQILPDRLPYVARYAMLPAALIAAESVDLIRFTPAEIARAVAAWRLPAPAGIEPAAVVSEWWQIYLEARPPWSVALAALDQMFG